MRFLAANVIQTVFGIFPTDPSLLRLPAAVPPLLVPAARCAPHLPDCAEPQRWRAPAFPVPLRLRQTDVHIEIPWFPAVSAEPWPGEVRAASAFAVPIAHPPALRSGASARCVHAVRLASWGPRSSNTHSTAISGRVKLSTSCKRCSYLVTRLSAPRAGPAMRCCCRPSSASRTASSSNCITGSRFVF